MADLMTTECLSVLGLVDCYLKWKDENGEPRGFERYHPSAFGDCLRKMQYQRYSERGYIPTPPDPHKPTLIRIFDNGHSMHDRWRNYFDDIHVLKGYWTCTNPLCGATDDHGNHDEATTMKDFMAEPKVWMKRRRKHGKELLQGSFKPDKCICGWERFKYDELDVDAPELNFHGHADMILDFSSPKFDPERYLPYANDNFGFSLNDLPKVPIVVDMKSANQYKFQTTAKGECPIGYQIQLMIYANVLDCEYGLLMYENKNNQTTTAYKIPRAAERLWPEVVRQASIMNDMVDVEMPDGSIDHLLPPPRPSSLDSDDCSYCVYKEMCAESGCWEDPDLHTKRGEFYGRLLDVNSY